MFKAASILESIKNKELEETITEQQDIENLLLNL
jgi:hypothetical protein